MRSAVVRQGSKYGPEYIDLLRGMCPDCVVLTDQPYPADGIVLKDNLPGWWSKIELFGPQFEAFRPCLYLDLDTYVLGDISDLQGFETDDFWMVRDFNVPTRGQSCVMIVPKDTGEIYPEFMAHKDAYMNRFRAGGDQDYLNLYPFRFLQDEFDGILSYKRHRLQETPRGRVICFHGRPKPHETTGWAKDIWDRYTRTTSR